MAEKRQNEWLPQNSTSIVLQQCQDQMSFPRKGPSIALRFLLNILITREHFLP